MASKCAFLDEESQREWVTYPRHSFYDEHKAIDFERQVGVTSSYRIAMKERTKTINENLQTENERRERRRKEKKVIPSPSSSGGPAQL